METEPLSLNNFKRIAVLSFITVLPTLFTSCITKGPVSNLHYDFNQYEKCKVSKKLREISALSYHKSKLYTIDDEDGIIYTIDSECELIEKNKFGKDGDYEGIEKVGNTVYILKSNGNIYEYKDGEETKKYNTALSSKNNTEGLGLDTGRENLLIACKGSASLSPMNPLKGQKAIYQFDLQKKELNTKPLFTVKDKDLEKFVKKKAGFSKFEAAVFSARAKQFSPSAIAVHPITKDYYILSSRGRLLVVFNQKFKIKEIEFLNGDIFEQPEGIAFNNEGDLFISNEGRQKRGKLITLKYKGSKNHN